MTLDPQTTPTPAQDAAAKAEIQAQMLAKMRQLIEQQEQSAKLLIRRDLELTRANERLRTLDQMKTDFVSVATHQMRTPLSGIRWTLSMLLQGDLGVLNNEQKAFLMKAYESNDRMITLLDDMLFSDRIESGKITITDEVAYAPDLIDNILVEIQPIADKRSVKLNFIRPQGDLPKIKIAPQHLRAILQNLIENAIKYSEEGGVVTIELAMHEGVLRICVSDTGIGIAADQQDKVFSRFFRAPNAVKMETDGSGLGLFIVKSIAEKHFGKAWFESKEGQGSKFFVELPIATK